jgi:glycosyltransferase involved in cell wall biosynthesis
VVQMTAHRTVCSTPGSAQRVLFLARQSFSDHARLRRHSAALAKAGFEVSHLRSAGDEREPLRGTLEVVHPWFVKRGMELDPARPLFRPLRSFSWRWERGAMVRAGKALLPDLIIACDPESLAPAGEVAMAVGARLVLDCQEHFAGMVGASVARIDWIARVFDAWGGQVDACLAVSDSLAEIQANTYPQLPSPVVIPNASDAPAYSAAYDGRLHDAAGWPRSRKIALFQGAFSESRGLEDCVRAGAALTPDWGIVLMGRGAELERLRALAAGHPNTMLLPPVAAADLQAWTAGATLGLIPYQPDGANNLYCLPNKLWEYASCGVPVLARALPEVERCLARHRAGMVFPLNGKAQEIASAICAFDDRQLDAASAGIREFYAIHGWQSVEARFLHACSPAKP